MTDDRWFNQELPPEGDQRVFVETLQELASAWRFDDLRPSSTHSSSWLGQSSRLVDVDVPGLTCEENTLRVLYAPESRDESHLRSEWAGEYMFDGPEDAGALFVSGVSASAEQCAYWTAEWLEKWRPPRRMV